MNELSGREMGDSGRLERRKWKVRGVFVRSVGGSSEKYNVLCGTASSDVTLRHFYVRFCVMSAKYCVEIIKFKVL